MILNLATSKDTVGNLNCGLAIRSTDIAAAYAVENIFGSAFNPAVVSGAAMMKSFAWTNLRVYFLANFSAAAATATVVHDVKS